MSCGHNRTVVLMIKSGTAKIDESNVGVFDAADFSVLDRLINYLIIMSSCHCNQHSPFGHGRLSNSQN